MNHHDALALSIAQINMDQELLIGSIWTMYETPTKEKIKVFFVLTEFTIYLFQPNLSNNEMNIMLSFSLFDLKGGESYSSEHFSLFLVDKILTFYGDSIYSLLQLIISQLTSMLLPNEVPPFKGDIKLIQKKPQPYHSLFLRFRGKLKVINRYPPQAFLDELQAYLKTEPTEFYFNQFKDINNYIEVLLESIEIEPRIQCLVFTGEQQINHWNLLSVFIRNNTTIKRIIISENVNRGFLDFCSALSKNDKSSLKRIDFINITFLPEHIEALDKMIRVHSLLCLSFTNCNIEKSKTNLITLLNSNVNPPNIVSVHFTSMNFNLYPDLSQAIFKLSILSLKGCCLQLSSILAEIKNTRIVKADFSKNRCTEPIPLDAEFPSTLSYIAVNGIKWNYTNFSTFIKYVTYHQAEISLSIANAEMTENDWILSFDLLEKLGKSNIVSLIWRENPIHYKLRNFIINSSKIWFLSFAGCHIPGDGSLQYIISACTSLKALDLHGTANSKLGNDSYSLLRAILNSNIEYLDISNNQMGNKCAFLLSQIMALKHVKQVLIDNNNFHAIKAGELFKKAIISKQPSKFDSNDDNEQTSPEDGIMTYVKYPENDFKDLQKVTVTEYKKVFLTPQSFRSPTIYQEQWNKCLSQKYEEENEIKLIDDPSFVIPNENQILSGSESFWNISLIDERKKGNIEQSVKREQISWDLNTVDIPSFDTTNIENQLSTFFSLENCTERLILSW